MQCYALYVFLWYLEAEKPYAVLGLVYGILSIARALVKTPPEVDMPGKSVICSFRLLLRGRVDSLMVDCRIKRFKAH